MANIKTVFPKVEEYVLVVSIPLESQILLAIQSISNISYAEKLFTSKRDSETNHARKVELDRARALMKWAATCSAHMVEMHSSNHKLKVSLGFDTMENMLQFCDDMDVYVSGATMK